MRWEKLGLIFRPDASKSWARSHAALPVPMELGQGVHRIFFSSRDADQRSHVGYFDLRLDQPERILGVSEQPVLSPGPLGYFDDSGIYAASVVRNEGEVYMYTIGWNPGARRPMFYSSIGLAISNDGGTTFRKAGRAPILARSEHDPCLVTSPVVIREGSLWRMWYVSGLGWEPSGGGLHSRYHIKYAESRDGVEWHRDGRVCIDFADADETNIARAWVLAEAGRYQAWFSYDRGQGYRIGHAISPDGLIWTRSADPPGLSPSESGFDSEALAYPGVVRHKGCLFMFYNGNAFGRDGIGIAIASSPAS